MEIVFAIVVFLVASILGWAAVVFAFGAFASDEIGIGVGSFFVALALWVAGIIWAGALVVGFIQGAM